VNVRKVAVVIVAAGALVVAFFGLFARSAEQHPVRNGVLWHADMEHDGLLAWAKEGGGGQYDSGGARSLVSRTRSHSGTRSVKAVLPAGIGGTRLFRWKEPREHRELTYSSWYLIPRRYAFTSRLSAERFWILFEFKSSSSDRSRNDPFWYVNAVRRRGHRLGATLAWGYQSRLEGPHMGQTGWRTYGHRPLPVGRWFQISARLRQSKDFDGSITVRIDGRRLASVRHVRTGWPSCAYDSWCVDQGWAATSYSGGIKPLPAEIYMDDAAISTR
jgi:hypothetical protein